MESQKKTLEGVRIVDFSHALAAPYGSMLLADQGADVIRIEPPGGDKYRNAAFGTWNAASNRNKRSVSLNLRSHEGKQIAKQILGKADVMVECFAPGTIEKMGFGYDIVNEINPGIIYCSISGFGQTGPYSSHRGFDVVAQAMSGVMLNTGDPDRPPVRIGTSAIDLGAGTYLAFSILLALFDKQKTGKGQRIDISLYETAISLMSHMTAKYVMKGELPQRLGSGFDAFCPYRVFSASDGYVFIGCASDQFWKAFCDSFEQTELYAVEDYRKTDGRLKHRKEVDDKVQNILSGYPVEEVVKRMQAAGVPVAPVLNVKQTLEDPHAKERGIFADMDHPEYGSITFAKSPIMRSGKMPDIRTPSPFTGQHTREVLKESGYSDKEIEGFISSEFAFVHK